MSSDEFPATLRKDGRITVPKNVRAYLRIKTGDLLKIKIEVRERS